MWIKTKEFGKVDLFFVTHVFITKTYEGKYEVVADAPNLEQYPTLAEFDNEEDAVAYVENWAQKLGAEEI